MNGEKILKLFISFLIVLQVLEFVFFTSYLNAYLNIAILISITVLYLVSTKSIKTLHIIVLLVFLLRELIPFFGDLSSMIEYQMTANLIANILLFYFLYYNHKSFVYNKRDVFTLVLGSSLYTVIFFMVYQILKEPMGELYLLGFLHLVLLYILLVVGAMHYINIRSEKSLWFFLAMLNFSFSENMLLIDRFYLESYELEVLILICKPLAMFFLVNYMITKSLKLKSEEFEGF
ncbi:hypothetical protein AWE51_20700 [Aquimarina aggregata]|uniref:YhhN-like protein n=2 Tax=Aquimarina TaxID=290174 RepID=A0A162FDW7_9FLAO|nr:hypothetical protein [Aquimarina aggregata]KZS41816.1 hypothetical protein AWE51_20700 [Aquimarina aggregata]